MVCLELTFIVAHFPYVPVSRNQQCFRIKRVAVAKRVLGSAREKWELSVWVALVYVLFACPYSAKVTEIS